MTECLVGEECPLILASDEPLLDPGGKQQLTRQLGTKVVTAQTAQAPRKRFWVSTWVCRIGGGTKGRLQVFDRTL